MIVITEKSNQLSDHLLYPYVIECEYDEIVGTALDCLQNYEQKFEELFRGFDIGIIDKKLHGQLLWDN